MTRYEGDEKTYGYGQCLDGEVHAGVHEVHPVEQQDGWERCQEE